MRIRPPDPAARKLGKTRSIFGQKGSELQFGISHVNEEMAKMSKENKELQDKVNQLAAKKAAAPVFDAGKMQTGDHQAGAAGISQTGSPNIRERDKAG